AAAGPAGLLADPPGQPDPPAGPPAPARAGGPTRRGRADHPRAGRTESHRAGRRAGHRLPGRRVGQRDAGDARARAWLPARRDGEKFSATLTLEASQDTQARVHLLADGRLLSSQDVNLTQGSNSIVMPQEQLPPGFHLFRVQIEASADSYIQNNEGGSYTVVT